MSQTNYQESFLQILNGLNTQQRIAVEKTEGPFMVVAGPGTGKTQILSARIGNILLNTDTQPENILCLTYTNAGAINMRKRLLKFIGPTAYKINIFTFHSLCNDIIQDNLSLFEKTNLDLISDIETIDLFRQLIDGFNNEHPLKRKRGNIYYDIDDLKKLFATMKKEGLSNDFIQSKIEVYKIQLAEDDAHKYKRVPKDKNIKVGDFKESYYKEIEKMQKLSAAVNEFANYQQLMKKLNRYDYDDMIVWIIEEFKNNPNFLLKYQEQFQYILVDEYQDTSGNQNELVNLISEFWGENRNLFVVGDDDQSIYRFQGANIENLENFIEKYAIDDSKMVVLTDNYRSTKPIIHKAELLIKNNQQRLSNDYTFINKNLLSANKDLDSINTPVTIVEYKNAEEEMMDICLQIENLIIEKKVHPASIAVLYKENKFGEKLIKYLEHKNIPIYCSKQSNLLNETIIQQIITILTYIQSENETPNFNQNILFEILHYAWFNNRSIDILNFYLEHIKVKSLRQSLSIKNLQESQNLFPNERTSNLLNTSLVLEQLIEDKNNTPLVHFIEKVFTRTGLIKYITQQADCFLLLKKVSSFFDFIKEEARRNPAINLKRLLELFTTLQTENISISFNATIDRADGVNLLTVHSAKGLEFDYVFLMGANSKIWEDKKKMTHQFNLPETIFKNASKQSDVEETRRLFYVAITRPIRFLQISYPAMDMDGKEKELIFSTFISEIFENSKESEKEIIKKSLTPAMKTPFLIINLTENKKPTIAENEANFINPLLENFELSVTALNNYLSCPLKFYYNNLIRVPSAKSEALSFGTAIHWALEKYFENMLNNQNQFGDISTLVEYFRISMNRQKENFSEIGYNRKLNYGQDILISYHNQYHHAWPKIVTIERNVKQVLADGIPIKGKLDKLEFFNNDVNIVDYKTGDFIRAKEKLLPPTEKNEMIGGDYWRQAVFYKLLIDNYQQKNWNVISTSFDFIEPDKNNQFNKELVQINSSDTKFLKEQIKMVWDKIQSKQFYEGCGKLECEWCNFAKKIIFN